jgi:hypothetical protein
MDDVDRYLVSDRIQQAAELVDSVERSLPCLDDRADIADVGRFAQQESLVAFYDQDSDETVRWGLLARYTLQEDPWEYGPPAWRDLVDQAPDPPVAGPDGGLSFPRGGGILLNGLLLEAPKARVEVPHLVQVVDRDGLPVTTAWQDGAAFAPELLGPPLPLEVPEWYVSPPAGNRRAVFTITAIGTGTLAGGLWLLSAVERGRYQTFVDDVDEAGAQRAWSLNRNAYYGFAGAGAISIGFSVAALTSPRAD